MKEAYPLSKGSIQAFKLDQSRRASIEEFC